MTPHSDVLGQMRNEWRRLGRTRGSREAFVALAAAHPLVALKGLDDLGDVVDALEVRAGRTIVERADMVKVLLEGSGNPLVRRALLQTLIPGIVSVCRQLRFGDGIVTEPSETVATALGLASELLAEWSGQSRQYCAPDILSALRGRLRRWLLKEKAALRSVAAFERCDEPAAATSPLEVRLGTFRGSPYDRLARLTYARVFEGRSLRELARDDHSAPGSLQAELQRFALRFLL